MLSFKCKVMKTRYKIFALSAAIALSATSCQKDFLDKNPLNSVSTHVFWNSEKDVQTALAGVYSRLQQNFLGYERVYLDGLTDNAFLDPGNSNQTYFSVMATGSISPALTGAMVNMYSSPYRAIASCNYFLDNVDKAPLSETAKAGYKAQVRFIRALSYFDLVQAFGDVIIYRNYPKTVESSKIDKSPKSEVYTFIEEDLDFAIANLPNEKYNGYAVKGSAQGIKVRVLLTQEKWAPAAQLAQQIINDDKFDLADNYAALFKTSGQASASVNREIMFSTQYLAPVNVHRTSPGAGGMDIELGLYSLMQPYKNLADDYEMTDGKSASESPLYNPANPYANRDPRLDLTVKLPNEVWRNAAGTEWNGSYTSYTGFLTEKYVDLSRAPFTTSTATLSDQDYIHLRYADILLMYAEAKNESLGTPDASIYDALDKVRGRTGINMPPVDRSRYNTKELLREYIRHERRVELALEGHRYNDLKRWKIAHIKLPTLQTPNGTPLVFEMKNYTLPIPLSELEANPNLRPNPDYE